MHMSSVDSERVSPAEASSTEEGPLYRARSSSSRLIVGVLVLFYEMYDSLGPIESLEHWFAGLILWVYLQRSRHFKERDAEFGKTSSWPLGAQDVSTETNELFMIIQESMD